jgi:hypothetical protein
MSDLIERLKDTKETAEAFFAQKPRDKLTITMDIDDLSEILKALEAGAGIVTCMNDCICGNHHAIPCDACADKRIFIDDWDAAIGGGEKEPEHKCQPNKFGKCKCGKEDMQPHPNGDLSYVCGSDYCRCAQ